MYRLHGAIHAYGGTVSARDTADSVITALTPAAWYRNATDVVSSGGFASIWADYASSDKGLVLPGVAGNYASTPDSVPLSITGDLDIRVDMAAATWDTGTSFIVAKDGVLGTSRSYSFWHDSGTQKWTLDFYPDGTSASRVTAAAGANTGFSANSRHWIRATLDVDNGAGAYEVKFWTSDDGASWTQLGTTITGGSTTSIGNTTTALEIGDRSAGTSAFTGRIYEVAIYSTIGGTTSVFDADFSSQAIGAGSFTESSSNAATVTINASGAAPAHIGKARDLLQGTGTNQPAYADGVFTFDGADNFMAAASWGLVQPEHVFVVVRQNAWADFDAVYDGATNSSGFLFQRTASPNLAIYANGTVSSNPDPAIGDWAIMSALFSEASSYIATNANANVTGNAGLFNMGGITMGASGAVNNHFGAVSIKEFVLFDAALSAEEASSVITALNNALTVF